VRTDPAWVAVVLADFDAFLLDHACCERKAAALCLSYIARHADKPALVEPLIALAREELAHFQQVYRLIQQRGLRLGPDEQDAYARGLLAAARQPIPERFLDRLVIAALIEARGYERFHLLAAHLPDPELARFYREFADAEAGHFRLFLRAARRLYAEAEVEESVARLSDVEAHLVRTLPHRPGVH
jgi:tRNA-(ms[2]io[6]A)-hydroxylase